MRLRRLLVTSILAGSLAFVSVAADESLTSSYPFATPVFGLDSARDGSLLVADAGAGIVRLHGSRGTLIAGLPGVSDVAPAWFGLIAVTGGTQDPAQETPLLRKVFRVVNGKTRQLADLAAFETSVNPDGGVIESTLSTWSLSKTGLCSLPMQRPTPC
jgi:hypothetical protein